MLTVGTVLRKFQRYKNVYDRFDQKDEFVTFDSDGSDFLLGGILHCAPVRTVGGFRGKHDVCPTTGHACIHCRLPLVRRNRAANTTFSRALACFNGFGIPDSSRVHCERHHFIRKIEIIITEYVRDAMNNVSTVAHTYYVSYWQ